MKRLICPMIVAFGAAATASAGATAKRARHPSPASAAARPHALKSIASANIAALLEPNEKSFINAVQIYPWSDGALYRLFTAPGLVSDITLEPGENLISVAAGDTTRWIIGDTSSGSAPMKRTHILVKPIAAGLHTNLVITTDRRVYLVALASTGGPAMTAISWTYPADQLIALKAAQASVPVAQGIAIDQLNFNYRIEGAAISWTPVRAFDDGQQTFIEFPRSIGSGEIPPLFVIGSSGQVELVNYRLRGNYYVVDRLFARAELRLGTKRQLVVRIVRMGASKRRGGA